MSQSTRRGDASIQWAATRVADVCEPVGKISSGPQPYAAGVERELWPRTDRYVGTGSALVASGLVRLDQLPGQPGNGKTRCTFDAAGRRISRGHSSSSFTSGRMTVERISATRFRVSVNVSREEQEKRRSAFQIQDDLEREAAQPFEFEPRPVVAPRARGTPVSRETVERLTELLAEAARGNLTGFAYAAMYESRDYHVGAVGEAYRDPIPARGMAMQLGDYLGRIARGEKNEEDDEDDDDDWPAT